MDNKVSTNAAISYAPMLGELFLLAKNNPNFAHPFIRNHAKNATKIHFSFLVIILIYTYFIEGFLYFIIPIIGISINNIILFSLFSAFTFLLIKGAHSAQIGREAKEMKIKENYFKLETQLIEGQLSETQKMIYITSYIPFVGLIIATRHNSPINKYGAKISGIFSIILVFFIVTDHPELVAAALLLYIGFAVTAGVMMFMHQKIVFSNIFANIPDLQTIYALIRAGVLYAFESVKVIFGKKEEISYQSIYNKVVEKDTKFQELANTYLTSNSIVFGNKLIYIPVLNIIYLPKYIFDKRSRYTIAIVQGLTMTVLLSLIMYFDNNIYSPYSTIIIFPVFIGLANIDANPFYRIPIIFDIYVLCDKLTFGIFSKINFIKEKRKEVKEVSFKV